MITFTFSNKRALPFLLLAMVLALYFSKVNAASLTWLGNTTDWSNAGNWSGGIIPTNADTVTITSSPSGGNFTEISSGTATVKSFIVNAGAIVTQTGGTLQIYSDWLNNGTYNATNGIINFKGNAGSATFFNMGTNQFYDIIIDATINPKFDAQPGSNILIAHDFTNNNTTLDQTNKSTFIFNGTGTQNIYSASASGKNTFGNLEINSSGTVTLTSRIEVIANFTITSGAFSTGNNNPFVIGGSGNLNGGSFNMNASSITITGNFTNSSCAVSGNACTLANSGNMNLTNGSINLPTGNVILAGNFTNNSSGVFSVASFTFSGVGKTIGGTSTTNFSSLIISNGTITVNTNTSCTGYSQTNTTAVNSLTLSNGIFFTVNGNATINQSTGFVSVHALNVNGGTAIINGNIVINVTSNILGRIAKVAVTNGTLTVNGNIIINNATLASNGLIDMSGGAGTLNLTGNITVTTLGTITPGANSIVNFNGNSQQTINFTSGIKFNNIYINNTAGVTLGAPVTAALVTGDIKVESGVLNNGGFAIAGAAGKTFSVADGALFNLTSTSGMVTGFTTKTFGISSTVDYKGTDQSIGAETYGNLLLSGSGIKTMPGASVLVLNGFTTSGSVTINSVQTLTTNGCFTIGAGTTFNAGSYSHSAKGNWINNGTFNGNTSTFTFDGSSTQNIGGSNTTTFNNLTINNPNNVSLNLPAFVSTFLTMSNGKIITSTANTLTLQQSADASIGSVNSFVDGPMIQTIASSSNTIKTFPIGKSAAYRPVVLSVNHSDATPVTYQAEVNNASAAALSYSLPGSIEKVSLTRYISISRQAVSNFTNATVQMYYGSDDGVTDFNNLRLVNDDGAGNWINIGGMGSANTAGSITSSSFSSFNPIFALANATGGLNPLPIMLAFFKAVANDKKVKLNWVTLSESNNDHFEVQRASTNLIFQTIAYVKGGGNSYTSLDYGIIDNEPFQGRSYYRLEQTDFNGKTETFDPIMVEMNNQSILKLYPTVSNGHNIHLSLEGRIINSKTISIMNMEGKSIPFNINDSSGKIEICINDANNPENGLYFIAFDDGENVYREKIIIMK